MAGAAEGEERARQSRQGGKEKKGKEKGIQGEREYKKKRKGMRRHGANDGEGMKRGRGQRRMRDEGPAGDGAGGLGRWSWGGGDEAQEERVEEVTERKIFIL